MTPRDLALRLAVVTVLQDRVAEERELLRAAIVAALDNVGADSVRAELQDGTRVAKAGITVPKPSARVTDPQALTEWASQAHPTEVVWRVRESFQKGLLDRLKPGPDGHAVDPDTGEVIPGVTFVERDRYPSLRFESDGRERIAAALSDGSLSIDLHRPTELEG
jgi:hypothetical protein